MSCLPSAKGATDGGKSHVNFGDLPPGGYIERVIGEGRVCLRLCLPRGPSVKIVEDLVETKHGAKPIAKVLDVKGDDYCDHDCPG